MEYPVGGGRKHVGVQAMWARKDGGGTVPVGF